jgi:hypothetical protein
MWRLYFGRRMELYTLMVALWELWMQERQCGSQRTNRALPVPAKLIGIPKAVCPWQDYSRAEASTLKALIDT